MDKKILRAVLGNLNQGDVITLNFFGGAGGAKPHSKSKTAPRGLGTSGEYRVVETYTGRGKGGSRLIACVNTLTGVAIEVGTPVSEEVLNITVNGSLSGNLLEAEVPRTFLKNRDVAVALKLALTPLVGREDSPRIKITSGEPEFNGEFTVRNARLNAGRFGQISMELVRDDGTVLSFWSYRHSGVVDGIEILDDK